MAKNLTGIDVNRPSQTKGPASRAATVRFSGKPGSDTVDSSVSRQKKKPFHTLRSIPGVIRNFFGNMRMLRNTVTDPQSRKIIKGFAYHYGVPLAFAVSLANPLTWPFLPITGLLTWRLSSKGEKILDGIEKSASPAERNMIQHANRIERTMKRELDEIFDKEELAPLRENLLARSGLSGADRKTIRKPENWGKLINTFVDHQLETLRNEYNELVEKVLKMGQRPDADPEDAKRLAERLKMAENGRASRVLEWYMAVRHTTLNTRLGRLGKGIRNKGQFIPGFLKVIKWPLMGIGFGLQAMGLLFTRPGSKQAMRRLVLRR